MLCSYVYFKCIFCLINCWPRLPGRNKKEWASQGMGARGATNMAAARQKCINVPAPRDAKPFPIPNSHCHTICKVKVWPRGGKQPATRTKYESVKLPGEWVMWGWLVTSIMPLACRLLPLPLPGVFCKPALREN